MQFCFDRWRAKALPALMKHILIPAAALTCLSACEPQSGAAMPTGTPTNTPTSTPSQIVALSLQARETNKEWAVDNAQLLPRTEVWRDWDRLVASPRQGLLLLATDGTIKARLDGRFDALDSRQQTHEKLWVASYDRVRHQAMVLALDATAPHFGNPLYLPNMSFGVEALCLYRDQDNNLQLFVVGEEGRGEQWLVGHDDQLLTEARQLRQLSLPPAAKFCAVDDGSDQLFVNEEGVGVWRYPALAETDPVREPVALVAPHGPLASADGLATVSGGVLIVDGEHAQLHRYARNESSWQPQQSWALTGSTKPEQLSALVEVSAPGTQTDLQLLIRDDDNDRFLHTRVTMPVSAPATTALPDIAARSQTDAVISEGDAADDPAIWVHPSDGSKSRVLATDKKYGLLVYDLNGKQLQALSSGDINNVDVRTGFSWNGETVDIAVAGNRSFNSLTVYRIERASGVVSEIANLPVPMQEIYGLCLYSPKAGEIHVIPNDKDGRFLQYRLNSSPGKLELELLREFKVGSQPEGCVADDRNQQLFVGEEDVAVWTLAANATASTAMTEVIRAGAGVEADIEGLGLYQAETQSYLVISSQGNDSYVVLESQAPHRMRGSFRVGLNARAGIDGVSETDGLEVSSANFGGAFDQGLLVLQDGRKRLPQGKQNFKYLAWADISAALKLN